MNDTKKRVLLFFLLFAQIGYAQSDNCYTIGFNAGTKEYAQGETHLSNNRHEQAFASFKEAKDYFVSTKENCRNPDAATLNEWIKKCDDAILRANGIEMVYVQGGSFTMGDSYAESVSVHQVTLSDFYIGKYEVTQTQWKVVMGDNPSKFKGDNLPVERVSWDDAQEFVLKLNAQTGRHYRLPTAAEWEYAARGGNQSKGYKYSGSNTIGDVAWYGGNSGGKTHPVGQKSPNELGIYDMTGNVDEWCSDWLGSYSSGSQQNPVGPSIGRCRVDRGGYYRTYERYSRVTAHYGNRPDNRGDHLGFRLVLPLSEL
jgi:formylglycine-generating enzyme required for sulfatase activity